MNEIIFRGKRTDTGDWIFGSLCHYRFDGVKEAKPCIHISNLGYIKNGFYEIDPKTIGQFSGLSDSNGNKIFEGDIVKYKGKNYLVIFWCGMFYASVEECNDKIYGGFPLHALTINADDDKICEIIGNSSDNSDLLINDIKHGRNRKN